MANKLYKRRFIVSEDYKLLLLALVVDLIIATFIQVIDPLSLSIRIESPFIIYGIYALIFYTLVLLLMGIHNELLSKMKREDYKKLTILSQLGKEGMGMRNSVVMANTDSDSGKLNYITCIIEWMDRTTAFYRELNPVRAERWATIGDVDMIQLGFGIPVDVMISILNNKLIALDNDIGVMLKRLEE